jgi:Calcineurin-like phosphoesterase
MILTVLLAASVTAASPPPVVVPWGNVNRDGGTVQRLWFGLTGDTRPGDCDDTAHYPSPAIDQIARSMKALHLQFGLDLGDHMFVCNGSIDEAKIQMGEYMSAIAQGPQTFWMTMGNHECGHLREWGVCLPGLGPDANFDVYMAALRRPVPWYSTDVATSQGLARFIFVADDAWCREQAEWLENLLTDSDKNARYTIVARHHPMEGGRSGRHPVVKMILRHKYSLLLTAHEHTYQHDPDSLGGRAVIVGVGGGPSESPPGFATVLQNKDGTLSFVMRDIDGNPVGEPWTVPPQ